MDTRSQGKKIHCAPLAACPGGRTDFGKLINNPRMGGFRTPCDRDDRCRFFRDLRFARKGTRCGGAQGPESGLGRRFLSCGWGPEKYLGDGEKVILVTGGAGTMGRRLAVSLLGRGETVRVLCLPGDPAAQGLADLGAEIAHADITRPESLPAALAGARVVFHLAAVLLSPGREGVFQAVNSEGTRNLVRAAEAAGAGHFIYVSSISVAYPRGNAYARSKLEGESWVKAAKIPFTIVRPTLAYEDGGAAEFQAFVGHLRKGPVVWLPRGGRARKNPVHVDDLAAGFLVLPGNRIAFGKTYVFSGGASLTLLDMARALLAHMGRPKPVLGIPAWLCLLAIAASRAWSLISRRPPAFTWQTYTGLVQDADFDSAAAHADLGYAPRAFAEGLNSLTSLHGSLRKAE